MDIARLTGLSKGTVDRVLHNRGEVSKKSREKVMEAVRELGYQPDLNASILARREVHTIALLVPTDEKGSFWELALSSGFNGFKGVKGVANAVLGNAVKVVPCAWKAAASRR